MLFPFQQITTLAFNFSSTTPPFAELLPNLGEECTNLLELNRLFNPFERPEPQFADGMFKYLETWVEIWLNNTYTSSKTP